MQKNFPIRSPRVMVVIIEAIVNKNPSSPALRALKTFIPKPSPTTEIFNNKFTALALNSLKGFPMIWAVTKPIAKAIAGEIQGSKQTAAMTKKRILMTETDFPKI